MSCVDKGKLFSLSGPLFPTLSNGDNNVFFQSSKDLNNTNKLKLLHLLLKKNDLRNIFGVVQKKLKLYGRCKNHLGKPVGNADATSLSPELLLLRFSEHA